jgi:hypothetical protein
MIYIVDIVKDKIWFLEFYKKLISENIVTISLLSKMLLKVTLYF